MAKKNPDSLFRRLTRLFRSGPVVKRKIRALDTAIAVADKSKSSGTLLFQKSLSPTYATITANAYNLSERLMRYQDFQEMEYTSEIASAMDIYADEACAQDDKGRILHIYSDNEKVKELLEDLFYGNLNVEFNLRNWVRNLVKYGDFFLYNDVHPEYGVINAFPIPVNEIEREENFDRDDPFAVRYRWVTLGNRTLENWEVSHFRLLGNDMFLPYGSSMVEPARRIWRQLILIEDAMLVYRVVRAPDRRVFYIDVANVPPEDIEAYVEEQKQRLRNSSVIDNTTGRVDLRYNPLSVDEDYIIPVRGSDTGTRIDTLAGGQNTGTVEDVEYIQKKLFAALKIPRAYLGYDEMLSSKATLAQEDIRFSRSVNVIQKTMIAELNKLAIIHLYANGYTDEDLVNFTLHLSNPSTVAQQQKLELWRAMFEIGGSIPEGMGSKRFVYKRIWNLNDDEIEEIDEDRLREKIIEAMIEGAGGEGGEVGGGGGGGGDLFGGGGGGEFGGDEFGGEGGEGDLGDLGDLGGEEGGEAEEPPEENAAEEPEEEEEEELELLTSADDADDEERFKLPKEFPPVKPSGRLRHALYNRGRRRTHGASKTHMPDFAKMTGDHETMRDPYDQNYLRSLISNPMGESHGEQRESVRSFLSPDMQSILQQMSRTLGIVPGGSANALLSEAEDVQDEIDGGQLSESVELDFDITIPPADEDVVIIEDYDPEDEDETDE